MQSSACQSPSLMTRHELLVALKLLWQRHAHTHTGLLRPLSVLLPVFALFHLYLAACLKIKLTLLLGFFFLTCDVDSVRAGELLMAMAWWTDVRAQKQSEPSWSWTTSHQPGELTGLKQACIKYARPQHSRCIYRRNIRPESISMFLCRACVRIIRWVTVQWGVIGRIWNGCEFGSQRQKKMYKKTKYTLAYVNITASPTQASVCGRPKKEKLWEKAWD